MDGSREFGVVLIERGSEVGGNDVRTFVGTVAQILDATELDDGCWVSEPSAPVECELTSG